MKNLLVYSSVFMALSQGLFAQTETAIVKPGTGETEYIVDSSSGEVSLLASQSVQLLPGSHIKNGSTFIAKIVGNPDSEFSVVINTVNLPNSEFEVITENNTIPNLISGNQDSEVLVETGPTTGNNNYVLINVQPTLEHAPLNLRVSKVDESYTIEVFQMGTWSKLSSRFYDTSDGKITFFNGDMTTRNPFAMNLVNGVEYDKSGPLTLNLDELISVSGASLEISGPDNFSTTVSPDTTENRFTWDGSQASPGVYKFKLQLQGKQFNGQFLIL